MKICSANMTPIPCFQVSPLQTVPEDELDTDLV